VHYIPVHLQPYYQKHLGTRPGQHPNAEAFYESELSLPLHPQMTAQDVKRVVAELKTALRIG
jgi:dTDP-4-amino-4,6-dideoxygalactose transaminase